jgi:3-isopropylmalate dehydrogenase
LNNGFVTKDIEPVNFYFTSTLGELISDYVSGKLAGKVNSENVQMRKSTVI